jgi:tetratricopeptide (TPR) repeat protein
MPKKISKNQRAGRKGETQFIHWAQNMMHWQPVEPKLDFGFDCYCAVEGDCRDDDTALMPGWVLNVSVRSTSKRKSAVQIDRSDAELLLSSSNPALVALVQRGPYYEPGIVAVRIPDEQFVRTLGQFLKTKKESLSIRFADAITDPEIIGKKVRQLFEQYYPVLIDIWQYGHRSAEVLDDPKVELRFTAAGKRLVIRSPSIMSEVDLEHRPDIQKALEGVRMPYQCLLAPLEGQDVRKDLSQYYDEHDATLVGNAKRILDEVRDAHSASEFIIPSDISWEEREKLAGAIRSFDALIKRITHAGRPTADRDLMALTIGWHLSYLVRDVSTAECCLRLMNMWSPLPIDVGKGVATGYLKADTDLPSRLRTDHPTDYEAQLLAGIIQSERLDDPKGALPHVEKLVQSADTDDKKRELFKLFQQMWQTLPDPEADKCVQIARGVVAHDVRLTALLEAAVLLRGNKPDETIEVLDRNKAEKDTYWLQLRGNALIQKGETGAAVDHFFAAAKIMDDPMLLRKTADIAYNAKRHDVAVWCYERLAVIMPGNAVIHNNLAGIYICELHDYEKSIKHLRALHEIEPENQKHAFNLALGLANLFWPDESLKLFSELCESESPHLHSVIARAQVYQGLGRPKDALSSLTPFKDRFWDEPDFLTAYMGVAYAAGDDEAAELTLPQMAKLQNEGKVPPEKFQAGVGDDFLEFFRKRIQEERDHAQNLHDEMLRGRMPWTWAEQGLKRGLYWGWWLRTRDLDWVKEKPAIKAQYCTYSTNQFHHGESEEGGRELIPIACPQRGRAVVGDISALITLHRLNLLDAAIEYFGEIMVPVAYLSTALADSHKLVVAQKSQQDSAELLLNYIRQERIAILPDKFPSDMAIVDEYAKGEDHRYRLTDLVQPIHESGNMTSQARERLSKIERNPSSIDAEHPPLKLMQEILIDATTLLVLVNTKLVDAVMDCFCVHMSKDDHADLVGRLEGFRQQEQVRQWHMDLWTRLRKEPRVKFVPHTVPDDMRDVAEDPMDYMPFMAHYVAQERAMPLMADDRVCQVFSLNMRSDIPHAAFGTDAFIEQLRVEGNKPTMDLPTALHQLVLWRYRFILPSPMALKEAADMYHTAPPGRYLRDWAEYVHDCMRDPGLFSGREKTDMGESMAIRLYITWVYNVAEFIVLIWADEKYANDTASALTNWTIKHLMPSMPASFNREVRLKIGSTFDRLMLSRVLLKAGEYAGNPRMADAMKALKEAMEINDDAYFVQALDILNDARKARA